MAEHFEEQVSKFIDKLKGCKDMCHVFNPWKDSDNNHDIDKQSCKKRCNNLRKYLQKREDAEYILIAEAPGYQGCHFSGIPMTSERLIIYNKYSLGESKLERTSGANLANMPKIVQDYGFCEPTATIVWNLMVDELGIDPENFVLWNAFPFHPYKKNNMLSNRKPKKNEILSTKNILSSFIELFKNKKNIICVGNVSENTLKNILKVDFKFDKVRHPANGGSHDFKEGMKRYKN